MDLYNMTIALFQKYKRPLTVKAGKGKTHQVESGLHKVSAYIDKPIAFLVFLMPFTLHTLQLLFRLARNGGARVSRNHTIQRRFSSNPVTHFIIGVTNF